VSRKNQICHLSVCSTVVFFQAGSTRDPTSCGHKSAPRRQQRRRRHPFRTAKPSPIPPLPTLCRRYYLLTPLGDRPCIAPPTLSHTVVAPSDGIKTKIIVSAASTASAVDERMDAGLRGNDDNDDEIDVARGEGAVGERRGQRVRQHRDGRDSDAEIEYGYRRSRRRTSYEHRGTSEGGLRSNESHRG